MVEPESRLLRIPVEHPLAFCIVYALTCKLVLKLYGHHRDTVHRKHHVHAVIILLGIVPLPDTLAYVLSVVLHGKVIKRRYRLKVAHPEIYAAVLETMSEHADKTVVFNGILKSTVELLFRIGVTLLLKALPCDRLRILYESNQRGKVQSHA